MKKKLLSVAFLISAWGTYAQVGIGTRTPNKSSQLEIVAKDKGVLIPQVSLKSSSDTKTITQGNVQSLLVFNTNSTEDLKPGYYYWYDKKWLRVLDSSYIDNLDTNTKNIALKLVGDQLVLLDSDQNTVSISLDSINKVTSLINNSDGSFSYTNELGKVTTIDISSMVHNHETLTVLDYNTKSNKLTYQDEKGKINEIDLTSLVSSNETLTSLKYVDGSEIITYIDEAGKENTINLKNLVSSNETVTSLIYDTGILSYLNEEGDTKIIDLNPLVTLNEAETRLIDNKDGTFTYFNEKEVSKEGASGVSFDTKQVAISWNDTTKEYEFKDSKGTVIGKISFDSSAIKDTKAISGTGIVSISGGQGATLSDVVVALSPGEENQILLTKDKTAQWSNLDAILPKTQHTLSKKADTNANVLVSKVNEVSSEVNLVESVTNQLSGSTLTTSVNGVQGSIDLAETIKGAQKTTEVIQGKGVTVTSAESNNTTSYTVAVDESAVTIGGDVTGSANQNVLTSIQGTPVIARDGKQLGQSLMFDGTNWIPSFPEVSAEKIADKKSLKTDGIIVIGPADGAVKESEQTLLKETTLSIADESITTDKIQNYTIKVEDFAKDEPHYTLVTDEEGFATWAKTDSISKQPWYVRASEDKASLNTQDIYQMGSIGIGTKTANAPLHVSSTLKLDQKELENNTIKDNGAAGSYFESILALENSKKGTFAGVRSDLDIKAGGSASLDTIYGQQNIVNLEKGSPAIPVAYGHSSIVNDRSGNPASRSIAGHFQNNQLAGKQSTLSSHGLFSEVILNPEDSSDFKNGYSYGNLAIAEAVAKNANIVNGGLRGHSSYAYSSGNTGRTFTTGDLIGGFSSARVYSAGLTKIQNFAGAMGEIEIHDNAGTVEVDLLNGLYSRIAIKSQNPVNVNEIAGVRVINESYGKIINSGKSYGVLIRHFKFGAQNDATTWNIYSDGTTTKNYIAGSLGVGELNPSNPVHIKAKENPVRIEGLQEDVNSVKLVTTDQNGVLKTIERKSLEVPLTASNGLNRKTNDLQLGGALTSPVAIGTSKDNTLAISGLQLTDKGSYNGTKGVSTDKVVVADPNGILKHVKAAMPKFFYLPSMVLPTHRDQITDSSIITEANGVFSVNLYTSYTKQFSLADATSSTSNPNKATQLPVLPAGELDYYVTYFDKSVYTDVKVTDQGMLTYKIAATANINMGRL